MTLSDGPDPDEIEVTLLGRGFGECVVIHLGSARWLIVDSHRHFGIDPDDLIELSEIPVARWYLDQMQVPADAVEDIFLTHFHKDHYEGVGALHRYYKEAQLLVPASLSVPLFTRLFGYDTEPPLFGEIPETLDAARDRRRVRFNDGLRFLNVGWSRAYSEDIRLSALSPMDAAIRESAELIARSIGEGWCAVRTGLRNQNWCSVVLHLNTPAGSVLLGADLETGPARFGWAAVLAEPSHAYLTAADLVKVPHHGSDGADHPPMWDRLVAEHPAMSVAPFERGSVKLPTHDDWRRLCGRGALHQAAPHSAPWMNEFGFEVSSPRSTGVVRARRRIGEHRWRLMPYGSAFHVNPLLTVSARGNDDGIER